MPYLVWVYIIFGSVKSQGPNKCQPHSPAFVGLFYLKPKHIKFTYIIKEIIMGKGKDSKKATKKAPTKTAKEKRAEKKLKKSDRKQ